MPTQTAIVVAGIILVFAVFAVFAAALAWADRHTRGFQPPKAAE
jgi:hypothetical protein